MTDDSVVLDTNVLLSATAPARALHKNATRALNEWPNRGTRLCTSGQILREYLVVATRPIARNGLGLAARDALANVDALRGRMLLLEETRNVFSKLQELVRDVECAGKQFHDANVVATALAHRVSRILTENIEDFARFESYVDVLSLKDA